MKIDPVVVLAEELRTAEYNLRVACEQRQKNVTNDLMACAVSLYKKFIKTVPTSVLGASELIYLAAKTLPPTGEIYELRMREIAKRLMSGQRHQADLIWLRAMSRALAEGLCGDSGVNSASLLELAIQGAARPIIVYRAVEMAPEDRKQETGTG